MAPVLVVAALALIASFQTHTSARRPDSNAVRTALSENERREVVTSLLHRVYAAFGRVDEFAIYDGLAEAVAADLVPGLYLQRRAAQETEFAEGGETEILSVALTDLTPLPYDGPGYRMAARWMVAGSLGHEDHRHDRLNAYAANITLGPADGIWKLTDFDLTRVIREEQPLIYLE